jgi:hypothetical protein
LHTSTKSKTVIQNLKLNFPENNSEVFILRAAPRHPSCWKRIADLSMLQLLSNNVIINSVDLNGITKYKQEREG